MTSENEPKIIVDDDWKEQVRQEKEQINEQTEQGENAAEMPEASFAMLVSTMSAQAMSAMGFLPDPTTGKANVNRPIAKHFIDSLAVLQEKTKGNLTDDENQLLTQSLHDLRMAFVNAPAPAAEPSADAPSIELP